MEKAIDFINGIDALSARCERTVEDIRLEIKDLRKEMVLIEKWFKQKGLTIEDVIKDLAI